MKPLHPCLLCDALSYGRAACEVDHIHMFTLHKGVASLRSNARYQVYAAIRHSRNLENSCQQGRCYGIGAGRLQDNRVSSQKARGYLGCGNE